KYAPNTAAATGKNGSDRLVPGDYAVGDGETRGKAVNSACYREKALHSIIGDGTVEQRRAPGGHGDPAANSAPPVRDTIRCVANHEAIDAAQAVTRAERAHGSSYGAPEMGDTDS